MKMKTVWYVTIAVLFLIGFFFNVIGSLVETTEGAKDDEQFIYGGTYWTSALYQLTVGNYLAVLAYFTIFITLAVGVRLWS